MAVVLCLKIESAAGPRAGAQRPSGTKATKGRSLSHADHGATRLCLLDNHVLLIG
jgi:hypothetical protein